MTKRAIIIAGGPLDLEFAIEYLKKECYDCIIAVDNGLLWCSKIGVIPNVMVGDFDTASKELIHHYECLPQIKIIRLNPIKDETDTEMAVDYCIDHQFTQVDLLGCTGKRFDHTLANVHMLYRLLSHNVQGYLLDKNNKISLIENGKDGKKEDCFGRYVSFVPFKGKVQGLTLCGFKYPLNKAELDYGISLGISNEVIEDNFRISIDQGILIMIESHD